MKVLVTGATGFLGGRLVAALASSPGISVIGLSRRPPGWRTGSPVVTTDLSHPSRPLSDALLGVDTVIHLAGANEVATTTNPTAAQTATLAAARSVIAEAASQGVRRMVYVSTIHVYGAGLTPGRLVTETLEPEPVSAYAAIRLGVERLLEATPDLPEVVVYRLSNTVGAPVSPLVERWTLVANDLCRQAAVSGALCLKTAGTQWRDFVPLVDVIAVLARSVGRELPPGTYNLASGIPASVLDLAHTIQAVASQLGLGSVPLSAPAGDGPQVAPYRIDVTKLAEAGARAGTPLDAAIEETLRFCVAHRDALA